ncbi:unnamed protein product [Rhodiola kirilowii]
MGIQGLLPLLKSIMVPIHIKELEGSCVAVDTYSWLHKGALSCSTDLCKGIPTTRHIDYCMFRVNLLRHHGVKPVMVFDGGLLPMKGDQENKRARSRKENLACAIEHEADGNSTAAFECYQKAVDISPAIAYELIQVLKRENVCYVVAPYEADAQLTFLAITKQVEAVITEDSDLIPFGCPRIIFKMDKFGQGVQFHKSMLQRNKDISFMGFSQQMVLEMCIMSGCDYLQSLPGMGLKKAHALIKKFKSYDKAIKHLRYSNVTIPPMYEESFKKAIWTFQYQPIYDPTIEDIVHLTELPQNMDNDLDFLGPYPLSDIYIYGCITLMPQHVAKGVAVGDLDPFTKLPFQSTSQRDLRRLTRSIASRTKKLQLPPQRNLLTNYMKVVLDDSKHSVGDSKEQYPSMLHSTRVILPCRNKSMLKEQESKKPMDVVGSKVRAENQKPVVRSSYFQTKMAGQDSGQHAGQKVCGADDVAIDNYKNDMLLVTDDVTMDEGELGRHLVKDCAAIDTGEKGMIKGKDDSSMVRCEDKSIQCASSEISLKSALPKLKAAFSSSIKSTENGKPVTRSAYFQRTKVSASDHKTEREMATPFEDEFAYSAQTNTGSDDTAAENFFGSQLKRKVSSEDDNNAVCDSYATLHGNTKWKKAAINVPQECDTTLTNNPLAGPNHEEGKFGCNISHLDKYEDISGKSFHSLTWSFKFNSSGSRASGLRAPLKDIRNIFKNRPTATVADISKFSFVPSKAKITWKPHRG